MLKNSIFSRVSAPVKFKHCYTKYTGSISYHRQREVAYTCIHVYICTHHSRARRKIINSRKARRTEREKMIEGAGARESEGNRTREGDNRNARELLQRNSVVIFKEFRKDTRHTEGGIIGF